MKYSRSLTSFLLSYVVPPILTLSVNFYISNIFNSNLSLIKLFNYNLSIPIINIIIVTYIGYLVIHDYTIDYKGKREEKEKLLIQPLKDETERLKEVLKDKENLLLSKAGSLIDKYSDLQRFQEQELLLRHLMAFTENNSVVHSAQLYRYNKKTYIENTVIKVQYVNGYVADNVDINALAQSYFTIPNSAYFSIASIFEAEKKLELIGEATDLDELNANFETEQLLKQDIEDRIIDFISEFIEPIRDKDIEELNDADACMLALAELCIEIGVRLSNQYSEEDIITYNIFSENDQQDEEAELESTTEYAQEQSQSIAEEDIKDKVNISGEQIGESVNKTADEEQNSIFSKSTEEDTIKEHHLHNIKRTGVLSGILKVNEHIFRHEGRSSKKGRIYISRCFELNGQSFIILLSVLPTIIEYANWRRLIMGLCNELISNMEKDLKVVYNSDRQ